MHNCEDFWKIGSIVSESRPSTKDGSWHKGTCQTPQNRYNEALFGRAVAHQQLKQKTLHRSRAKQTRGPRPL
jgi:hypothetical protein